MKHIGYIYLCRSPPLYHHESIYIGKFEFLLIRRVTRLDIDVNIGPILAWTIFCIYIIATTRRFITHFYLVRIFCCIGFDSVLLFNGSSHISSYSLYLLLTVVETSYSTILVYNTNSSQNHSRGKSFGHFYMLQGVSHLLIKNHTGLNFVLSFGFKVFSINYCERVVQLLYRRYY